MHSLAPAGTLRFVMVVSYSCPKGRAGTSNPCVPGLPRDGDTEWKRSKFDIWGAARLPPAFSRRLERPIA
jgi:hypothetical protein